VYGRTIAALAIGAALIGAGPAQADRPGGGTPVCNEAENSWQGEYNVVSNDPNPPAFNRGKQMDVGNGGKGLVNAAARSPALALCNDDGGFGGGPF